ncbi:acyl carrier protein [Helicobacter marmotae]|uniref:Acyl carrier protein n=1 Tax=Helicobacter marmotae TaxID=152490 RepID=A0A3D8I6H1_9HELI|nr:acyl carrier protein [Helicobacter marmotae]RDU60759.1 acyl carrier protein [Helicobacter marmotae]
MTQEEFLAHLSDALQRDEALEPNMELAQIEEWDSLALISTIALFESLFNQRINGNTLSACQYVRDIIALAPLKGV